MTGLGFVRRVTIVFISTSPGALRACHKILIQASGPQSASTKISMARDDKNFTSAYILSPTALEKKSPFLYFILQISCTCFSLDDSNSALYREGTPGKFTQKLASFAM